MKITGVSVFPAALAGAGETGCLVRLATDAGLDGLGLCERGDASLVESMALELLVGSDPRGAEALWRDLCRCADGQGGSIPVYRSAAALDLAVWDLKAKARGEPLWRVLGGAPTPTRACVRLTAREDGVSASVFEERVRAPGFEAGTLDGLTGSDADFQSAASLFQALSANGPNPELVLGFDSTCGPQQVQDFTDRCESRFDVTRVQVSGSHWSAAELRRLADRVAAAVSRADEPAGPDSFFPPLWEFCCDIIVIDPAVRGVTGALQLADAAYGYELPAVLAATPGNYGAHLASAMPAFMAQEIHAYPATGDWLATGVRVDGGRAHVDDRPGHGLDWADPTVAMGEGG